MSLPTQLPIFEEEEGQENTVSIIERAYGDIWQSSFNSSSSSLLNSSSSSLDVINEEFDECYPQPPVLDRWASGDGSGRDLSPRCCSRPRLVVSSSNSESMPSRANSSTLSPKRKPSSSERRIRFNLEEQGPEEPPRVCSKRRSSAKRDGDIEFHAKLAYTNRRRRRKEQSRESVV